MATDVERDEVQEALTRNVTGVGLRIARLLRETADNVERHSENVRVGLRDLKLDHASVAGEVARDISVMMGNLNLERLIGAAADADRYARGGHDA